MLTEKCAVFGIYGSKKNLEASRLVHTGLWALQHRGQESSGIASSNGKRIYLHKGMGLVAHVYNEDVFPKLLGPFAIGHNRYSTSGSSSLNHTQPISSEDRTLAFAHNGNLPITTKLISFLTNHGINTRFSNDSELMYKAVAYYLVKGHTLSTAVKKAYPLFTGAFSALFLSNHTLIAIRDPYGIRPLSLGKIDGLAYVISSETCAIDTIGASFIRDIHPGEMLVINRSGLHSYQLAKSQFKIDAFEFVYFARPDSFISGQSVGLARQRMGQILFKENPHIKADLVVPIPDSGIPAAIGFSKASGIPFDIGLIKNRYIHRTFIRPAQFLRQNDVKLKLNPLPAILKGKRIILIDDSIVRGTTSAQIVNLIRSAGASQVHFLASSPPVCFPDFYGIDIANQDQLIAANKTILQIQKLINADSLAYLSLKGMIKAIGLPAKNLCTSCFTGQYPLPIGSAKDAINFSDCKF